MSTEAVITASEYLASLGIDVAKEKVKKKIDEKKLRAVLTSYIESQSKYNEMCSLAEEIDFQGLVDYIRNNLISNTVTRVFDPNKKKRSQARQDIVSAAIAFSKANTDILTCFSSVSSKVEAITVPLTNLVISVTSSGLSPINNTINSTLG